MRDETVVVENLTKRFGDMVAVDDVSFSVARGELLCLLGPSGCGKTTLLRMLAGLLEPTAGEIYLNGTCVYSSTKGIYTAPANRGIGMMFQNYALWPHMTVRDNITYGLRTKKVPKSEAATRLADASKMMNIETYLDRYPAELSGGQQQRVALARMVVVQPRIFLMDEPLSNLDAKLRVHTRVELRRIQQALNTSGVYVTHDQEEALALADQIAVMSEGAILHLGPPEEIYENSRHIFVASFLGSPPPNFIESRIVGRDGASVVDVPDFGRITLSRRVAEQDVVIALRPEYCRVADPTAPAEALENGHLRGNFTLISSQFMGGHYVLLVEGRTAGTFILKHEKGVQVPVANDTVAISIETSDVRIYTKDDGALLAHGGLVL